MNTLRWIKTPLLTLLLAGVLAFTVNCLINPQPDPPAGDTVSHSADGGVVSGNNNDERTRGQGDLHMPDSAMGSEEAMDGGMDGGMDGALDGGTDSGVDDPIEDEN